ncbi:serine/threonine-protein kinase [Streptomyces sp. NPDC059639]|uniref:serine/threonine-protein kinase n=1 Tax=Streptomyces sp. NPDC059639 TaxID=3346891 RepID=UPI0036CC252B
MQPLDPDDPSHIGPYRLLGRLGVGGMGRVFLARSATGDTVAVKVVRPQLAELDDFRRRFAREVRVAQRVDGRWTAAVLDADTEAATPWVATAYVPGPTLYAVVRGDFGPLPSASAHTLANRMGLALRAIHGAGLVHRDLKPSNVLLTTDGPRVIDFGIAYAAGAAADSLHTPTGTLLGSPEFMSPEQVRGDPVSAASDVFALGCVLAFAATGRSPFDADGAGAHAVLFQVAYEDPKLDDVPEALSDLVRGCLAKDPADRPSVDDVVGLTRHAPPGGWLPPALLERLDLTAEQSVPTSPRRLGTAGPASEVMNTRMVTTDRAAPPAAQETAMQPARRRRVRPLTLTAAALALGAVALATSQIVQKANDEPAPPSAGAGELRSVAASGDDFAGGWTSMLDESEALFMMRIDIPAGAVRGDKVPFLSGRANLLCSGEAEVTSRKKNQITVGEARVEKTESGAGEPSTCFPDHVTLTHSGTEVMWQQSERSFVQIDRATPLSRPVPAALTGAWRGHEGTLRIRAGRAGAPVVTGTRASDGCTWSAALMTLDPASGSGPGEISVAPAVATESGCTPPRAAYRFYRDGDELVAYRMDKKGDEHFTRVS